MKPKFVFNSINSNRQDIDINLSYILFGGLAICLILYLLLLPFKQTFLGILLYERGFTQILVISLAGMVATLCLLKFIKLKSEYQVFTEELIPNTINLQDPDSSQIINFQQNLVKHKSLLAQRCSRVIAAYIHSSSREIAIEFAMEDSAFYQSVSESSYLIPRILVWAIPLLGFIGTVLGISQAVNGFSSFLQEAADLEQIKEGIGSVTGGLAIAFDTTLLALFLSVLVMIPLVFIERLESKLLLAIDIYINDKLIPRFKQNESDLTAESLMETANIYTKQVADLFIKEISQVMEQFNTLNQHNLQDKEKFFNSLNESMNNKQQLLDQQLEAIHILIEETKSIVTAFEFNAEMIGGNLKLQSELLANQLEKAANSLNEKVNVLAKYANQVNEISLLQFSLNENLKSLKEKETLETVLNKIQSNLSDLQLVMQKLNKPRKIVLVEQQPE